MYYTVCFYEGVHNKCYCCFTVAHLCVTRVFVYLTSDPSLSSSAGTWVTFGGQITDEVRDEGFCQGLEILHVILDCQRILFFLQ